MLDEKNQHFGLIMTGTRASDMDQDTIRDLLSRHGVLVFRDVHLDHEDQLRAMSMLGRVQHWTEQQAPRSYADASDGRVILLDNEDFLGKSRMGWHMDQTYLQSDYLPVRSLYCTRVDGENITEFADVAYLTDAAINDYGLPLDAEARYYIDSKKTMHSKRRVYSQCMHASRPLLRYDSRMELTDRSDSIAFKEYCSEILNGDQIPKISVTWRVGDFVIFDNNRCPHRRSVMGGSCHLSRLTSVFWLS